MIFLKEENSLRVKDIEYTKLYRFYKQYSKNVYIYSFIERNDLTQKVLWFFDILGNEKDYFRIEEDGRIYFADWEFEVI